MEHMKNAIIMGELFTVLCDILVSLFQSVSKVTVHMSVLLPHWSIPNLLSDFAYILKLKMVLP